jgi:hypothetical protein
MAEEVELVRVCNKCAAELPDNANFCLSCGANQQVAEAEGETAEAGGESIGEMLAGFASGTAAEIKRTTGPLLKSETSKKVAAGAAIGAVAAVAVPFVSIGLGAVIGAGVAALRRKPS